MNFALLIQSFAQRKLTQDVLFLFAGNGLSQGLVLISNLYVARVLGIEAYGKLGIIQATLAFFGILSGTTFSITPQKYIAEYLLIDKNKTERILGMSKMFISVLSLFISLFMIFTSNFLAINFLKDVDLSNSLRIGAGILFCNSMFGAQSGILAGFKKFKVISVLNLFRGALMVPFMLVGGKVLGLEGVLVGTLVVTVIVFAIGEWQIKSVQQQYGLTSRRFVEYVDEHQFLFKYTLPSFVGGVITMPVVWWSNTELVGEKEGFSEMAIFSMANTWRLLILFVPSVINQPFISALASDYGAGRIRSMQKKMTVNIVIVMLITIFIICCLIFFSDGIVNLYGEDFKAGKKTLILLSMSAISAGCAMTANNLLFVLDKVWIGVFLNGVWSVLFLVLVLGIQPVSALNLSWAYFISYALHLLVSISVVFYILNTFKKRSDLRS